MPDVYNSSYTGTQIDAAVGAVINKESSWDGKQDKLTGAQGQVVGFDDDGDAVAMPAPDTGVTTFNGRTGAVMPQAGDYDAADVGAIPASEKGAASGVASLGSDGKVPAAQLPDMDYVPTSRTVNGKALSADITLSASDVGARPNSWTPSAADVGAVPTSRKVNGKALSNDISLNASDVGARADTWMPSAADVGARPDTWTPSAQDIGALPIDGGTLTGALTLSGDPTGANQAATKAYVDGKAALVFTDISVTTSMSWSTHSVAEVNDQGFTQRVTVPMSGITLSHIPIYISFDVTSRYNGNWSDYCDTYNGGLYLYAKEAMAATIESATFVDSAQ